MRVGRTVLGEPSRDGSARRLALPAKRPGNRCYFVQSALEMERRPHRKLPLAGRPPLLDVALAVAEIVRLEWQQGPIVEDILHAHLRRPADFAIHQRERAAIDRKSTRLNSSH